jgi:hypothetical protein
MREADPVQPELVLAIVHVQQRDGVAVMHPHDAALDGAGTGHLYNLTFDMTDYFNHGGRPGATSILDVSVGDQVATFSAPSGSYVAHSLAFRATASTTTLRFTNVVGGDYPELDNVSVVEASLPEPASLGLVRLAAALAAAAPAAHRRLG